MPLTQKQEDFLDWLLIPASKRRAAGVPESEADWCEANGMSRFSTSTTWRWKKSPEFHREWERRLAEFNLNPERVQVLVDGIYKQAMAGSYKHAELFLKYIGRQTPDFNKTVEDRAEKMVETMSDEELDRLISDRALTEKEQRQLKVI